MGIFKEEEPDKNLNWIIKELDQVCIGSGSSHIRQHQKLLLSRLLQTLKTCDAGTEQEREQFWGYTFE